VPCDLHLEHLNRHIKGMIRRLHSNVTQKAISRAVQSVSIVHQICGNLTSQIGKNQDITHSQSLTKSMLKWLSNEESLQTRVGNQRHINILKVYCSNIPSKKRRLG